MHYVRKYIPTLPAAERTRQRKRKLDPSSVPNHALSLKKVPFRVKWGGK